MRDSTRLPYPRSFLGLLLTGFTLVMLPLVGSLAYSAWNTERLAAQSRTAVFNASQAARASRSLVDRIGSVERLAQQIALLDDPELGADYARVHHSFRQLADEIAQLPLDATQSAALASTVAQEQSLYGRLTESPRAQLAAGEIAEIDAAIRQLGGADFSRPIAVRGPEDLRYLGRRLDWLRRRLDEFETQKNRFLRHVSHELKTPLTALREGAELLHDEVAGPLAPPQRQVVAIMRDNSVKLQRLIEELLDYQRALHAAASLEIKPVMLDQLVAEATRAHHLAAQAKGLRLLVDAQPAMLEADPEKLRSIVDNLISNAVKFTPSGGVISVRARALAGEAVIEVMDSGPGVAPEERESIFNLFFRGRTKADTGVKGSGLGLAIARELVEAHGGEIAVVAGGAGGHFRVTLPRRGEKRAYS